MATLDTSAAASLLERLGVDESLVTTGDLVVRTPITGEEIGRVARTSEADTAAAVARAVAAFAAWRDVPAPRRGELVRLLGEELRAEKQTLGALVTLEVGKIAQEGLGEPKVSIIPLPGVNAETVLTFAWDITWYQYRVTPDAAQPVRIADRGHDLDEVDATHARWNARFDDTGRLVPDLVTV
jgi:hypothetical protein